MVKTFYLKLSSFFKYLNSVFLFKAGMPIKEQIAALDNGVDIIVATPGRLDDLISTERLSLSQVRFFILDEVDGLLGQGMFKMMKY